MGTTTPRIGLFKPNPDPVTGDDVDVTDLNDNADKIDSAVGFLSCTSGTRPASPYDGQAIYETDTNKFKAWVEGAWTEVGPVPVTLSQIYPVGSIYISTSSTNPNTTFGFGTWAAIQGRVLIGADGTYTGGSTGGAATKTLTSTELPSHSHAVGTLANAAEASHTHGVGTYAEAAAGTHTHSIGRDKDGATGTGEYILHSTGTSGASQIFSGQLTSDGSHSHTLSGSSGAGASHNHTISGSTASTGTGSAFNILPPYLAVYIWQRTA